MEALNGVWGVLGPYKKLLGKKLATHYVPRQYQKTSRKMVFHTSKSGTMKTRRGYGINVGHETADILSKSLPGEFSDAEAVDLLFVYKQLNGHMIHQIGSPAENAWMAP